STEQRELAKMLVHASNYMVGKRKFGRLANVKEEKAQQLLNQYYTMFPCIKLWHMEVKYQLQRTRTLTTPWERKRTFFGRMDDDLVRAGIAYVPQSTVGDLLNFSIIRMYENGMPDGWDMLLQNHDAVLFQVPLETSPMLIYKYIHHFMEYPITIHNKKFIIPADIKLGPN